MIDRRGKPRSSVIILLNEEEVSAKGVASPWWMEHRPKRTLTCVKRPKQSAGRQPQ